MLSLSNVCRSLFCLGALTLGLGCGSDSTGPKSDQQFTSAEAATAATAILTEVSHALSGGPRFDASAATASVPTTVTQSVSGPCTNGGTISGKLTMTMDLASGGTGTESGVMTVNPVGCKVPTGTRVITVDGNLTYTFDFKLASTFDASQFKWHGVGDFTWTGGSCKMDYTVTTLGSKSTVTGMFCGVDIGS